MDHIEIILKDIKNAQIKEVLSGYVLFDVNDIISSHFFDKEINKDITYQDIKSLEEYFNDSGTCNIYLKKAIIGTELDNVLILISFDEISGDITINLEAEQLEDYDRQELKSKLKKLLSLLIRIYKGGEVGEIILGFEPADNTDMKILGISQNQMEIFNENIFESPLVSAIYSAARDMSV